MAAPSHLLAERLNSEPPVSRGCSVPELLTLFGTAVAVCLPLGGLLGWQLGVFQLGLAGGVIGIVVTLAVAPTVLQRLKRDRPDGYPRQWVVLWLHDRRLWPSPYVRRSGAWDLGRTLQ